MNQLFISYSRKDTEIARQLTDRFTAKGLNVWVDWQDIPPSVDWIKEIQKGIEEADIFLFLISPDSVASQICKDEIAHAALNGKRIIPAVVRDVDAKLAPPAITHYNWIFFSRPQDVFEGSFEQIQTAIHTDYDWVQVHRRLQMKALEWERSQQEYSFLLRGKDLQDAEAQLMVNGEKDPKATELQNEFVRTSRTMENKKLEEERVKEQQLQLEKSMGSRLRRLTYLMLGVFTVAFVALFFWLNQVTTNLALTAIKDQMLALVETSVCFIDGDEYDAFIKYFPPASRDVYDDYYYSTLDFFMNDVIATNQNIAADVVLYTIARGGSANEIFLIASTEKNVEFKTALSTDNVGLALREGMKKSVADLQITQDEHGSWVSACAPIHTVTGESVGALCTDFSAQLLTDTREKVTTTLGIAFLAIYPAMIVLVVFSARSASTLLGKFEKKKTK